MEHELAILSCRGGRPFAEGLVGQLNEIYRNHAGSYRIAGERLPIQIIDAGTKTFADGEIYHKLSRPVRGKDVYIVQCLQSPIAFPQASVNDNFMELLLLAETAASASAKRVTAVIPYMPYGRADKQEDEREPISAQLAVRLMKESGIDHVLSMDFHAEQIRGFYRAVKLNVDVIPGTRIFYQHLLQRHPPSDKEYWDNAVVFSPDAGGVKRIQKLQRLLADTGLTVSTAHGDKLRTKQESVSNEQYVMVGDVSDKHVIIYDDMIGTGGSIDVSSEHIVPRKPRSLVVAATHLLMIKDAYAIFDRLHKSQGAQLIGTNTIPQKPADWLEVIDVTGAHAMAIFTMHTEGSMSDTLKGVGLERNK